MKDGQFITMAIESSCDETAVAVLAGGRTVLSNIISSQIDIFKQYGGVVPEIASRQHLENINRVIAQAMDEAEINWQQIDLIGVTKGPGLIGALLVGVATAKALAFAHDIPLVGVHHILGHISANFIAHADLEPPFMALVTSGGHTLIAEMESYTHCRTLGGTRDDAVGEAYDKVARVLGLGYPGGAKIDKLAREGNPQAIAFKRIYLEKESYDFSFSGLKTAVLNYLHTAEQTGRPVNKADVAASFQQAMLDVLVDKAVDAACRTDADKLVLAGGVAANSRLREMLQAACTARGIALYRPPSVLCTDNAAMIGCAAYYQYMAGGRDGLDLEAVASLPL